MNYIQEYFSQPLVMPPRLITRDGLLFRKGRIHIDRFVNTKFVFYHFYALFLFKVIYWQCLSSSSIQNYRINIEESTMTMKGKT